MKELEDRIQRKRERKMINPEPRYDEVFFQGLDELDKISSVDMPPEFSKTVDDNFWELI